MQSEKSKASVMPRKSVLLACAIAAVAFPALAQIPAENIRGKVRSLDGDKLVVTTREGKTAIVTLSKDWGVAMMKPVDMNTIKPGSFIGTTEIEKPGGGGQSLEVHVFPPGMKMGEGHYPWDLKPGTNMTNGTVTHAVLGGKGRELDVEYPTGVRHITVPPTVPVVVIGAGDRMMIKPGVALFIHPTKTPEGGFTADRVLIGEKGEAPPM
jgi:hypothetical protein